MSRPHQYLIKPLAELPSTGDDCVRYGFGSGDGSSSDCDSLFEICPDNGIPWRACFRAGGLRRPSLARVLATWNPAVVCVEVAGAVYFIDTSDMQRWSEVASIGPVVDVKVLERSAIVICVGFTRLAGFDGCHEIWTTRRVSWDGIRITDEREGEIAGLGWDSSKGIWVPFSVALTTGEASGGAAARDRQV